jgi:alkylation response protein AidB-like acyl-CoA dehydrogenase
MASTAKVDSENKAVFGAGFLFSPAAQEAIFTPENFSEEQIEFQRTAMEFAHQEVLPQAENIEIKKPGVMIELMKKAAEIGLFTVEVPEEFGGLDIDKTTAMIISEALAINGSFAVTYGAHTGIGTLPIVYYGTQEQKARYLPKLATGEFLAAYALSEPSSGSDALAAKTTAVLSEDGKHYVLNGTKQWITNAAWADLITVFAQVDGEKFSAFLVETNTDGVTIGREERKMGIRGSSTCSVILEDAKIPIENLLGEVGRGHKIAFNILNIGRWKLGISSMGGAKNALALGAKYANERKQFKKPIGSFGLIRQKLARSATLIFAGESMAYRTAGLIDGMASKVSKEDSDYGQKAIAAVEEFTVEASILKVFGSEVLGYVADEMLQIYGGNGFVEDYPLERIYRDARINRIFEGTNEINRLIIPATLFKRVLQGRVPLMQVVGNILGELQGTSDLPQRGEGPLANEIWATELTKRAVLYAASYAAQKYMEDLKNKQRLLGDIADCITDLYGMDSSVCRAQQMVEAAGGVKAEQAVAMTQLYCFEARADIFQRLRRVAMIMAEGQELDDLYDNLAKLDKRYRVDYTTLQDQVAEYILDQEGYQI